MVQIVDFTRMSGEEILEYVEFEAKKKFEVWKKDKTNSKGGLCE